MAFEYVLIALGAIVVLAITVALVVRRFRKKGPGANNVVSEKVTVHRWLYWTVLLLFYVILPGVFPLLNAFGVVRSHEILHMLLIGSSVLHLVASIRLVPTDFISAIEFLTLPVFETSFQIIILPFGFSKLYRITRAVQQHDIPGTPEQIYRDGDKSYNQTHIEQGFVLPMRITTGTGGLDPLDKGSHLDKQLTLEFILTPRWRVVQPFQFLVNIENGTLGRIEEVWKQMIDTSQDLLTEECSRRSGAGVIRELAKIKEELRKALQKAVDKWGIKIIDVAMKSPDLSHPLSVALRDISKASADAEGAMRTADGEAYSTQVKGIAAAVAAAAGITQRGKATKEAMQDTDLSAEQILAADTGREVLGKTGTIVLGAEGLGLSVAGGATIVNALGRGSAPPAAKATAPATP